MKEPLAPLRARAAEEGGVEIPWWGVFLVVGVAWVCLLHGIGALGLVGPDEPRYAAVARSMAASGDWITPRFFGQPWLEKPALYYWIAAAASRVWGANEFAMRLPAALGAVLATAAMGWAALRSYGLQASWLTLLILPTTMAAVVFSRAASMDMLFSGLLAAAAAAAVEILQKPRAGPVARAAFGIFLGAATLAKGPAAVVLAAGAVCLWSAATRQWRAPLRLMHPVCVAAFAMVAVPWYALCAAHNPDFVRVFFVEHNLDRYLTTMFHHEEGWWFYAAVLPVGVFPWTALLVPLVADARKSRATGSWRDSPAFFFACWAVFPILFFSVPESKLPGYILPSMPPLMLLIAVSMARRLNDSARSARWWIVAAGASISVPYAAASIWLSDVPARTGFAQPRALVEVLALITAGGVACAVLALRRRERLGLALAALTTAAMIAVVNLRVIPAVDTYVSARAAALATPAEAREAPDMVAFQLDDPWEYGLEFYLSRELPQWTPDGDRPTWVWTSADGADVLERAGLHYEVANHTLRQAWLLRAAEPPAGATSDVRPTQEPLEGTDRVTGENSLGPAGAAEKN